MSLSTLGKIGMADKLSVAQLQQAVKSGSLPAYIGIPLIQEKMKEEQEAKAAMAAQNTPQNSVAEQVMAQATQQEMSGLGDLPTNLPEQYASGGIIGYDEGGDITQEEYDDQIADAEFDQFARAMINRTPNVEKGLRAAPSMSYGQVQGQAPRNDPVAAGGLDALIEKYAAKHGVPVDLARNIAMAESGGSMNQKGDPRSSARGPFGMIESTWKSLGGTAENRNDPEANVDLGIKLIKQNAEAMKGSLGKNPSYGDVYAAHHFGTGVNKMLTKTNPNESIEEGLSTFESPKRIQAIMQANPHLRGKTVGEVRSMLSRKGGEGTYEMAEGGIASIKRYAGETDGSLVQETDDPDYVLYKGVRTKRSLLDQSAQSPWNSDRGMTYPSATEGLGTDLKTGAIKTLAATGDVLRSPLYAIDRAFGSPFMDKSATPFYDKYVRQAGLDPEPEPVTPASTQAIGPGNAGTARRDQIAAENKIAAANPSAYKPQTGSYDKTTGTFTAPKQDVEPPKTTEKPAEKSSWQSLRDLIDERKEERKAQKEQDMWLALMAGGLGAMAGTSQYAGVNIGQGAMHGLQQYGTARREAAKEEAADVKNLANIARYEEMGKYYNDQLENKLATTKGAQDQKEYIAANNVMKNLWEARMDEAKYMYGDPKTWDDPTRAKAMAFVNQVKSDPKYIDAERRIGQLQGFSVVGQRPAA